MAERPPFQFRLRDLLWAVSLIGVSLGLGVATWRTAMLLSKPDPVVTEVSFFLVPAFIGCVTAFCAGIGSIFRESLRGAVAGVVIAAAVITSQC